MQSSPPRRESFNFRTIWISDVHLGFHASRAEDLLSFLHHAQCETLYLVGDIIDLWSLEQRPHWPQAHNEVIRCILAKARNGARVVYLPGNHDHPLRSYAGCRFGNVEIQLEHVHTGAKGQRLLVLHGDRLDGAVMSSRRLAQIGSRAYEWLLHANVAVNALREKLGYPYWSLAGYLKHRVPNAVEHIARYERAAARAAAAAKLDGVVCGHIHKSAAHSVEGVSYFNCGDWVESCTALVEHPSGVMEVLAWRGLELSANDTLAAA